MHRKLINEAIISLAIETDGPVLIKAGESGADPTRPDMEFVRTHHNGKETVYLPGSSLKGVIRSHAERIARTVDRGGDIPLSCNPLGEKSGRKSQDYSCNKYFTDATVKKGIKNGSNPGAKIYRDSCFVCRMFGNTALSSHIRIADAYPINGVRLEERNGVAIDRIFGSVAVGPFQFEVATEGKFETHIYIKNFTLAQLGLLALTLRDIQDQRVPIGFAKSRGLGKVKAQVGPVTVRYPTGGLMEPSRALKAGKFYGVGSLVDAQDGYGFPEDDFALMSGLSYHEDGWCGLECRIEEPQLRALWIECVRKWSQTVRGEN